MRSLMRSLTFALLFAFAAGCRHRAPSEAAANGEARTLRVMTYNIAAGGGNLARIANVIRASGADIVGLQEVDVHWHERSGFADQATELSRMLNMQVRFAPIYHLPGQGATRARQFGVAVLSRFPVSSFRNHPLTRHSTMTPAAPPAPMPGFLDATLDVHGTPVRVFGTHLDYRADPAVRRAQVAEMLVVVSNAGSMPVLLLGDLNANPDAPELQPLLTRLADAWPGASGRGFSYPSAAPAKRIDYVLHSANVRIHSARVLASPASDHLPVLVELSVPQLPRSSSRP